MIKAWHLSRFIINQEDRAASVSLMIPVQMTDSVELEKLDNNQSQQPVALHGHRIQYLNNNNHPPQLEEASDSDKRKQSKKKNHQLVQVPSHQWNTLVTHQVANPISHSVEIPILNKIFLCNEKSGNWILL